MVARHCLPSASPVSLPSDPAELESFLAAPDLLSVVPEMGRVRVKWELLDDFNLSK